MALWLTEGTVAITQGSKAIVGTGTHFQTATNPAQMGQPIYIHTASGINIYEIESVQDDTHLNLTENVTEASAATLKYAVPVTIQGSFAALAHRAALVMSELNGVMVADQNLSEIADPAAALGNLGVSNFMTKVVGLQTLDSLLQALGVSAVGRALQEATDQAAAQQAIGLTPMTEDAVLKILAAASVVKAKSLEVTGGESGRLVLRAFPAPAGQPEHPAGRKLQMYMNAAGIATFRAELDSADDSSANADGQGSIAFHTPDFSILNDKSGGSTTFSLNYGSGSNLRLVNSSSEVGLYAQGQDWTTALGGQLPMISRFKDSGNMAVGNSAMPVTIIRGKQINIDAGDGNAAYISADLVRQNGKTPTSSAAYVLHYAGGSGDNIRIMNETARSGLYVDGGNWTGKGGDSLILARYKDDGRVVVGSGNSPMELWGSTFSFKGNSPVVMQSYSNEGTEHNTNQFQMKFNDSAYSFQRFHEQVNQWFAHHVGVNINGSISNWYFKNDNQFQIGSLGNAAVTGSDRNLKKQIVDAQKGALERICSFRPREFVWKHDERKARGFIAQEAQAIDPIYVFETMNPGNEDMPTTLNVDDRAIIADLIASVQALKAEIEELKNARS